MALITEGRSYWWIVRDLGISKNAAADIARRGAVDNFATPLADIGSRGELPILVRPFTLKLQNAKCNWRSLSQ